MNSAIFYFQDELNIFLPEHLRGERFAYPFKENPSIKHLIEALGVPHTEVGRIQVNGQTADFYYHAQDGDQVEVFSAQPPGEASAGSSLSPVPESEPRFVLDNHLGRLAAYLRMLGFDCLYQNAFEDEELASLASSDRRILLTRDRRLLMRNSIIYGYFVRDQNPHRQMLEVVRRYNLYKDIRPFQRCLRCNTPLELVDKEAILAHLEPLTRLYFNEFRICPNCEQIYWKGSHYDRMLKLVESARGE